MVTGRIWFESFKIYTHPVKKNLAPYPCPFWVGLNRVEKRMGRDRIGLNRVEKRMDGGRVFPIWIKSRLRTIAARASIPESETRSRDRGHSMPGRKSEMQSRDEHHGMGVGQGRGEGSIWIRDYERCQSRKRRGLDNNHDGRDGYGKASTSNQWRRQNF